MKRPFASFLIASTVAAAAIAACGGGSGNNKSATPPATITPAGTRVATGTPAPASTPSGDIRSIDIAKVPDVAAMVQDTGGQFSKDNVLYTDLTGDGVDEAVVPISSGGTMGDIAFLVLTTDGAGTKTLLREYPTDQTGLAIAVKDGKVVMTQPVPGPDDPLCCPSFLKHTTYGWNGYAMAIEGVTTDPNPNGGAKGTPSAGTTPQAATTSQPPAFAPEGTAASGNRPPPPPPGAAP